MATPRVCYSLLSMLALACCVLPAHARFLDLTADTYHGVMANTEYALVFLYSPTCGHCNTLRPKFMEAAEYLGKFDNTILTAALDVTVNPTIGQELEVRSFPQMKWFIKGKLHSNLKGIKERDGIIDYVKEMIRPKVTEIKTVEELKAKEAEHPAVILAYFKELQGGAKEVTTFAKLSVKVVELPVFLETTDVAVAAAAGIKDCPGAAMIRNFPGEEREIAVLDGKVTKVNLIPFINANRLPLTFDYNKKTVEHMGQVNCSKTVMIWSKAVDLKPAAAIYEAMRAVAKEFRGELCFVSVNNENEETLPVANHFSFKGDSPVVLGYTLKEQNKYNFTAYGTVNEKNLRKFTQAYFEDKLAPYYKSEPVPENADEDGVTKVVGHTFKKIIDDYEKDVLLYVHAPYCETCVSDLDTLWPKLAARFAKVKTVCIAKFDGSLNEHPDIAINQYPSIILYPGVPVKPSIPYLSANRSLNDFTKFLKDKAKHTFELPKKKKKSYKDEEEAKGADKEEL